ncbi:MAG TPA: fibronectin type III domain-containing protein, partial [Longimicrobiales bacterium]|nr:fibronectin type III domain-containing protein [Longimicrobiales bacterium]
ERTYPGDVTGLTAAPAIGPPSRIDLSWNAATGAGSYEIWRSDLSDPNPTLPIATVTGTSHSDSRVVTGTAYTYRVRACTAGKCSAFIQSAPIVAL